MRPSLPSARGRAAACSPGIVIGKLQKLSRGELAIAERSIEDGQVDAEQARFEQAVADSVADFDHERLHLMGLESQEPLHILDAQRLMLLDTELSQKVIQRIRSDGINAEWAVQAQIHEVAEVFDHISDDYLRARKSDIEHVGQRILGHLAGRIQQAPEIDSAGPVIVAAEDFTPIEVMRLWRQGVVGFIAEKGGPNAHSIIIARGIGLSALMGTEGMLHKVHDGDQIVVDGEQGLWLSNPSQEEAEEYLRLARSVQDEQQHLYAFARRASLSNNGHALPVMANLELEDELSQAQGIGAEGVGLFRTEFLLEGFDRLPGEEEQFLHYDRVMQAMQGRPVTFRLMDIGGEKPQLFEHLTGHRVEAANPSLGLRGVRLLLNNKHMLTEQLRALLRASSRGEMQILVPMISRTDEMEAVRSIMHACARELGIKNLPSLGAMIEVPAAVMIAEALAGVSDFFSIGTNDLIQYTLAADRSDKEVAYLYDTTHPALEPMLRLCVQAARQAGIPIAMCGELASDLRWTEQLMNMGFDSLSMSLHHILPVRKHLSSLNYRPET